MTYDYKKEISMT